VLYNLYLCEFLMLDFGHNRDLIADLCLVGG
jgi:hypothetical protein